MSLWSSATAPQHTLPKINTSVTQHGEFMNFKSNSFIHLDCFVHLIQQHYCYWLCVNIYMSYIIGFNTTQKYVSDREVCLGLMRHKINTKEVRHDQTWAEQRTFYWSDLEGGLYVSQFLWIFSRTCLPVSPRPMSCYFIWLRQSPPAVLICEKPNSIICLEPICGRFSGVHVEKQAQILIVLHLMIIFTISYPAD